MTKLKIYDSARCKELSVSQLINIYNQIGVSRIIYKALSPNDNSKNQPYMGMHLTDLGFLPTGEIIDSPSTSGKTKNPRRQIKYTASLNYLWVSPEGDLYNAPNAKLIYYPQYPEVRLSGFLSGAQFDMGGWMDPARKGRAEGRVLFFGIKSTGEIYAFLAIPETRILKELEDYATIELSGVFREIAMPRNLQDSCNKISNKVDIYQTDIFESLGLGSLETRKITESARDAGFTESVVTGHKSSRDLLLDELRRIHLKHWISSKRLRSDGLEYPYKAPNGGGYTLEAELGIIPNGIAEPDYLGWEVKQFGVKRFDLIDSKPLTVMTPEPNGGYYVEKGVEYFVRQYGYLDIKGRENRYNFNGRHCANVTCEKTGLTLVADGYDSKADQITNSSGAIALVDKNGNVTASWSFTKIMAHWKRKHSKAVYIPSLSRQNKGELKAYHFGNMVRLFEGTSILQLLKAMTDGYVYYDPGIKLENANNTPVTKRRSQFRIKSASLEHLYEREDVIDLIKK